VLFYLSNIEFQRHQELGTKCELTQPIEIVLAMTDTFKFRDDLEREYANEIRVESEDNQVNLVLPTKQRTSSIDYVVIDDPQDPDHKNKIKIKIENTMEEQRISIENKD
jgi:hypothetical protein